MKMYKESNKKSIFEKEYNYEKGRQELLKMKKITYKELEKIVQEQPAAFLCGNGFSINFDSDFANIYDRLYEAHKLLLRSGKYDVRANNLFNKVFKDNYKNVCKYIYTYKKKDIEEVFVSGIYFAESIIKDADLIKK